MKHLVRWNRYFVLAAALALALAAAFLCINNVSPDLIGSPVRGKSTDRRIAPDAAAFWESANVPDPGEHVLVTTIRPEDLGIAPPTLPVDPAASIARSISENNLPAIQSTALFWFQRDPAAAREWLASQSTLEDLQPAISYIANHISDKGDIKTALEWAKLLNEGTIREDTIFDIHALALRNGWISLQDVNPDGIPPERFQELQSGAAGD